MSTTNGATPAALKEARLLIRVRGGYTSAQLRLFIAAAEHITPPESALSDDDERILRAAKRLAPIFAEREPHAPSPFDDRIAAAAAEEALGKEALEKAKQEVRKKAKEARWERLKGLDGDAIEATAQELKEAKEELRLAEVESRLARVARTGLEYARSRWRASARLPVQ